KMTCQGFEFFEDAFGYPYPFHKYDQLYVPEYNMGAMENAGCITLRDEYLPRSRQDAAFYEFRCSCILHEMAHMWFGDLVTMKWWDDLWLNESFAEWACYHAAVENTSYSESWTGFTNARKNWALRQDQLPSTHPIAADNYDLRAVEVNFDGITYAKGASVLKQLVAWVGIDEFMKGLGQYFKDHAYANAEFVDLLTALEQASGRELDGWAKEWLQTSGVNTLSPEFELAADGRYASIGVRQTAAGDNPTLRRHRIGIGLYDERDGHLVRRRDVEIDVEGELTPVEELVGERQPDLLLLNDGDFTYAKIRLDERSLATVVGGLRTLDDSLARALCWGAAWDMTRDAEMKASDYVALVLQNIGSETDAFGIRAIPNYASLAVNLYSDPARRPELRTTWEAGLRDLLHAAEPGSNAQLIFARLYARSLVSEEGKAEVAGLLDGSVTIEGLDIDTDLRWVLLVGLAASGAAGDTEIDAELARDRTISGQENAAAARASRPDAAAKAAAWNELVANPDVPNETHRSIATSFMKYGQEELLAPYLEKYLDAADTAWEELGTHMASNLLEDAFPLPLGSPELVERVDRWLEESPATPAAKRYVREGRADVVRALAAQARDAER
ncbi:MAG TPA: aminopeptidase N, partial [Nocardioides sp.]|uniref:aminopeptidase N n=1 Tax=Nocardioides sp. TaxID=35761 RepID=UPI002F4143B6